MGAVDAAEQREIEQFYESLSTQLRLFGAEAMGRRYVVVQLARLEVNGFLSGSELAALLGRIQSQRDWYRVWEQEARRGEEEAAEWAARGRRVSAAQRYLEAAAAYHWGQSLARVDSAERAAGRAGRVRCYRLAVDQGVWDIRPLAVPFQDTALPAYLHVPASGPRLPACVVMVDGADSVKEEYHRWARQFVRRGLAVCTFDGPGQGELVGRLPMRPEAWEEPMAAVLDALAGSGLVDPARVGAWGSSTGGFLVSRAAAFEPRLKAVVASGGFYDFRRFPYWPLSSQLNIMEDLGVPSLAEARAYMARHCSLEGVAERIRCPYLVIHAGRDHLVEEEEARLMTARAPQGAFICLEEGYHTSTNVNSRLVPLMCDWLAEKLEASA